VTSAGKGLTGAPVGSASPRSRSGATGAALLARNVRPDFRARRIAGRAGRVIAVSGGSCNVPSVPGPGVSAHTIAISKCPAGSHGLANRAQSDGQDPAVKRVPPRACRRPFDHERGSLWSDSPMVSHPEAKFDDRGCECPHVHRAGLEGRAGPRQGEFRGWLEDRTANRYDADLGGESTSRGAAANEKSPAVRPGSFSRSETNGRSS
jgi:hypothetical protein